MINGTHLISGVVHLSVIAIVDRGQPRVLSCNVDIVLKHDRSVNSVHDRTVIIPVFFDIHCLLRDEIGRCSNSMVFPEGRPGPLPPEDLAHQ